MCITDECESDSTDRRTFIATAVTAVAGLAVLKGAGQTSYPHNEKVLTRGLDDPKISHGSVVFKHGHRRLSSTPHG